MNRPIGIFDSGVGGLTVFREVVNHLPHEDLIYFGDTARLPYGSKSPEAIIRYSLECATFLLEQNIKLLIVACHTASAHALEILQEKLPIPVIGVIQPGFELLMQSTRSQRIAILGTESTIASGVYQNLIRQHYPMASIFAVPCPLFVPLAEERFFDHAAADLIAAHYLDPLKEANIDAALLACTHYPLLKRSIHKALGPSVKILESAFTCAEQAQAVLCLNHTLNPQEIKPAYRFYATDHPIRFSTLAKTFLGYEIHLTLIELEKNKKV
ncbi:MAG: Glutamate racemase [Parachlamydiales bacterium]|nr:Glutamate racemase [Parachlamydiales bacterium]